MTEGATPNRRAPAAWTYAVLGASAIALQTVFVREFLALFHSSEAFAGAVLGIWLVFVGAGSALGEVLARRPAPGRTLAVLYAGLGLVTLAAAPVARALPGALGVVAGTLPPVSVAVGVAAAAMFLPCLLVGASFPLTAAAGGDAARLYAWDACGGLAGGAGLAALISILVPDATVIASLAAAGPGALSLMWGRACARRGWIAPGAAVIVLAIGALALPGPRRRVERATIGLAFPEERVLDWEESPEGRRVLARAGGGGRNLYVGGALVSSEVDASGTSEFAALAALSHPAPRRVEVLSTPADPLPGELARLLPRAEVRASVSRRGALAEGFAPRGAPPQRPPVYTEADARAYLGSLEAVDLIAYQPGMPEAFLSSRLVSAEAFGEAARAVSPGGLVAVRLPVAASYLNTATRKVVASVVGAAGRHFAHVRLEPMPHAGIVLLASDAPLARAADIARRYAALESKPRDFKPGLLGSGAEREFRLADIRDAVAGESARPNTDFLPSAIWYASRATGSMYGKEGPVARLEPGTVWPAALLVALVAGACLAPTALARLGDRRAGPRSRAMGLAFAAGAAGMLLEVTILCAYQVRCGALYGEVSLVLGFVMAGTGLGAWLGGVRAVGIVAGTVLKRFAFAAGALAPAVGLALATWLAPGVLVRPVLWAFALATGTAVGAAYPVALALAGRARGDAGPGASTPEVGPAQGAGYVLAADLAGAGAGAAVAGGILVPLVGLVGTALAGATLACAAVMAAAVRGTRAGA